MPEVSTPDAVFVVSVLREPSVPPDGLSQDEIAAKTGWSNAKVNDVLCAFPVGHFGHHKVKLRGSKKVTKYFLKDRKVS